MKKATPIIIALLIGCLVGYGMSRYISQPSKETVSVEAVAQPKWSVEEFAMIQQTQAALRLAYDECVNKLNQKSEDLKGNSDACSLTYWLSEEAKLLRTNYGDEATPNFLTTWNEK